MRGAFAEDGAPKRRRRGLQIVDSQGRVRASIQLLAAEAAKRLEMVLLRLITENGRPSVKIAASEPASCVTGSAPRRGGT